MVSTARLGMFGEGFYAPLLSGGNIKCSVGTERKEKQIKCRVVTGQRAVLQKSIKSHSVCVLLGGKEKGAKIFSRGLVALSFLI